MGEEFIEPDQASVNGMARTAIMRGGINHDKVYPGSKVMPSIHGRNNSFSMVDSEDTDPTPPHGIERP